MSIQAEIARIVSAKQDLADWLVDHNVRVSIDTNLNELVDLLDSASIGGSSEAALVPVSVSASTTATISKTITPKGTMVGASTSPTNSLYRCPANSMLVLYGTCNGGSSTTQAYPTVNLTGDLTSETVYYTGSNSTSTRPMGIFVVHIGTEGGTVTFTRATSKNAVI